MEHIRDSDQSHCFNRFNRFSARRSQEKLRWWWPSCEPRSPADAATPAKIRDSLPCAPTAFQSGQGDAVPNLLTATIANVECRSLFSCQRCQVPSVARHSLTDIRDGHTTTMLGTLWVNYYTAYGTATDSHITLQDGSCRIALFRPDSQHPPVLADELSADGLSQLPTDTAPPTVSLSRLQSI